MTFLKQHWRWTLSVWIAFVFVQSLFFKFSGSHETQHIVGTLGEWVGLVWFAAIGGYLAGGLELIASVILFTRIWPWGAVLVFGIISGAIVFHLFTPLGMVIPVFDNQGNVAGNDGGTLFIMACITWICALALVLKDWIKSPSQIRSVLQRSHG